jgi:hypothetical protein
VPQPVPAPAAALSARRPGPPAKLVVPILTIAALCFAFGIWALTGGAT